MGTGAASAAQWYEKGNACVRDRRIDEAIDCYRRAVALDPGSFRAHSNLGVLLEQKGLFAESVESYRAAVLQSANAADAEVARANYAAGLAAYRNHLFQLHRMGTVAPAQQIAAPAELFAAHRRFAQHVESHAKPAWRPHTNGAEPDRRLRVGYVSPDFRKHSVAHFIEPILAHHDRTQIEVFGYYSCPHSDEITRRFESTCDQWRDCDSLSDDVLADRIRADAIDILVDLAGHTFGNRLGAFALKPAPLQFTYLGYPGSTGFEAIDYLLTDPFADPGDPGTGAPLFSERLLHIAPSMLTYRPPFGSGGLLGNDPIPVTPAPILKNGFTTFGSFNDSAKIADFVIATWARILAALPDAILVLKSRAFGDEEHRDAMRARFEKYGADFKRLRLLGRDENPAAHLARYADIDISLDTFPYNGVTTSLESLWMGVPFVTLSGTSLVSRMGVSIATNVGHPEWIGRTMDEYVATAVGLAANPQRLDTLRQGLRNRLEASPLMDARGFALKLEAAYRAVWRRWCEEHSPAQKG